jgi:hypothetical protein
MLKLSSGRGRLVAFIGSWIITDIIGAVVYFQFDDIGASAWKFGGIFFLLPASLVWYAIDRHWLSNFFAKTKNYRILLFIIGFSAILYVPMLIFGFFIIHKIYQNI